MLHEKRRTRVEDKNTRPEPEVQRNRRGNTKHRQQDYHPNGPRPSPREKDCGRHFNQARPRPAGPCGLSPNAVLRLAQPIKTKKNTA